MSTMFTRTLLAAVLGLGAVSASVPAMAAGPDAHVETVGYRSGFHGRDRDERRWDRNEDRRWDRGRVERRGSCSPRLAIEKARSQGIRQARIADVTPRLVVVDGKRHHRNVRIAFANVARCPAMWR